MNKTDDEVEDSCSFACECMCVNPYLEKGLFVLGCPESYQQALYLEDVYDQTNLPAATLR